MTEDYHRYICTKSIIAFLLLWLLGQEEETLSLHNNGSSSILPSLNKTKE